MGRRPCCAKVGLNRGAWSALEDTILTNYIKIHGEGKWRDLPQLAGLKRCGKSCRLRWLNYLRPDIKRGDVSLEEEDLIIKLHKLLGNRWSLIAGRLPGRTDNEIKNYWNTSLSKRMQGGKTTQHSSKKLHKLKEMGCMATSSIESKHGTIIGEPHRVIRTKAVHCTKVIIPPQLHNQMVDRNLVPSWDNESPYSSTQQDGDSSDFLMDFNIGDDLFMSDVLHADFNQAIGIDELEYGEGGHYGVVQSVPCHPTNEATDLDPINEASDTWRASDPLHTIEPLDLKTLASFLNSEEE